MILNELYLNSFKNYNTCSLKFKKSFNFIYGNNGNGKTNLLESISLLCLTKSFLSASDQDCTQYHKNEFSIKGIFGSNNRDLTVEYRYNKDLTSKTVLLNKEKIKKNSEIIGMFPVIILSSRDSKIINGTPNDRRRNFDIILSQESRIYLNDLKVYNRIVDQRNVLLKDYVTKKKYSYSKLIELLEPWTEKLIEYGTDILLRRIDFIKSLSQYQREFFIGILGQNTIPVVKYRMFGNEIDTNEYLTRDKINSDFQAAIKTNMKYELQRGVSMTGPHRDDYLLSINKNGDIFDLKYFGSQGEQKVFLISMKFSEYTYLRNKHELQGSDLPMLLLDDPFSELDRIKVDNISKYFNKFGQVFFTTTDINFKKIIDKIFEEKNITYYRIYEGKAEITV